MNWSSAELEQLEKFFSSAQKLKTLYKNVIKINPTRSFEAVARKVRREKRKRPAQVLEDSLRVGFLDLETTKLTADMGYLISWAIKPANSSEILYDIITRREILNYSFDKRLVKTLLQAFDSFDVLYGWYSSDWRFDFPFIRSRAIVHNLNSLLEKDVYIRDLHAITKPKLKLDNYRLENVASFLGVTEAQKTRLDKMTWLKASLGDKEALEYVLEHNRQDVLLTEAVYNKTRVLEKRKTYSEF